MNTIELLNRLGGTTPTEFNPAPGFTPLFRMRGMAYLDGYTPETDAEKTLWEAIPAMLEGASEEEHRAFRVAFYEVYLEQGFTPEDLADYFPDIRA